MVWPMPINFSLRFFLALMLVDREFMWVNLYPTKCKTSLDISFTAHHATDFMKVWCTIQPHSVRDFCLSWYPLMDCWFFVSSTNGLTSF